MPVEDIFTRFNRGEVSDEALARDDVEQIVDSCALMENFLPVRLGPMRVRQGFTFVSPCRLPATVAKRALIPLTRASDDSIMLDFTDAVMRVLVDGIPVEASADTVSLSNSTFASGTTGWTTGGTVTAAGGKVTIAAHSFLHQTVTVTAGQRQTHLVTVEETPCHVMVGTSGNHSKDLFDAYLGPGEHLIDITPQSTSVTFTLANDNRDLWFDDIDVPDTVVDGVLPRTFGDIAFTAADIDYRRISYDSSADVLFLAQGKDDPPLVFKRRDNGYTLERYQNIHGPYDSLDSSSILATSTSTAEGENSINFADADAVSVDLFADPDDIGRLIEVVKTDNFAGANLAASGAATGSIAVKGYGDEREILYSVSDVAFASGGTVPELQVSRDPAGGVWNTVQNIPIGVTSTFIDPDDGEVRYYRIFVNTVVGGSVNAYLATATQATAGHGPIKTINTPSNVLVSVYKTFMYTTITNASIWRLGAWKKGSYPQGVTIFEGRVFWASRNRIDGTVIDDYFNFNRSAGDLTTSAISRTIGFGPVDNISWVESTNGLFMGVPSAAILVRSDNFDAPLTNLNTNLKPSKGAGAAPRRAAVSEDSLFYVTSEGTKIHRMEYAPGERLAFEDQMLYHPEICSDGIAAMATSHHPEKRLWVLTDTGELRVLLTEPVEGVQGWARITVDGTVEDICVIPHTGEDEVWAIVRQAGQSSIMKLDPFSALSPVDGYVLYAAPTDTVTGLDHLDGEVVTAFGDNGMIGTGTVAAGSVTIAGMSGETNVYVGTAYTAKYQSNKLSQYVPRTVAGFNRNVLNTALILKNFFPGVLQIGRDFTHLQDLPGAQTGTLVAEQHDQHFGFNGASDPDSRICIQATGPATILGLFYQMNQTRPSSG